MTPESLQQHRKRILGRIVELEAASVADEADTEPISPDVSIGRLSRLDSMQMQQMALNAKRRRDAEIQKLKKALQRIDRGHYGICLFCRQPIDEGRLEVQPEAVACIRCAG